MVLATDAGQVFQSTDGGGTWNEVTKPPLSSIGLFGVITYNPYKPTEVWIACTDTPQTSVSGHIYKSTDAAFTSWQDVRPADGSGAQMVKFTGADSVYIGGRHSTDGGLTWEPFGPITGAADVVFDPRDAQRLLRRRQRVRCAEDHRRRPDLAGQGPGADRHGLSSMEVSPADPLRIFTPFLGWPGFYRSIDGAGSWSPVSLAGTFWVRQAFEDPFDSEHLYALSERLCT